jgi:hypothetical protein
MNSVLPRSKNPDWTWPKSAGNHRTMNAIFQVGSHRKLLFGKCQICSSFSVLLAQDRMYNPEWEIYVWKQTNMTDFPANSANHIFILGLTCFRTVNRVQNFSFLATRAFNSTFQHINWTFKSNYFLYHLIVILWKKVSNVWSTSTVQKTYKHSITPQSFYPLKNINNKRTETPQALYPLLLHTQQK